MTPERNAKSASTPKAGFLATLRAFLSITGTAAPAGFRAPASSRRAERVPAVLCGVAAVLALTATLGATSALAAPPTLTTPEASEVGVTAAHLSGHVNPQGEAGSTPTFWHFQLSETGEPGTFTIYAGGGEITGTEAEEASPVSVAADAENLQPGVEYFVQLVAQNEQNPETGEFANTVETQAPFPTFTTKAATAPALAASSASEVSYLRATLHGSVDPQGGNVNPTSGPLPIYWYLQYREAPEGGWANGGEGTIEGGAAESSGAIPIEATLPPAALQPSKTYEVRVFAYYLNFSREASSPEPFPSFPTLAVAKPTVSINPVTTFAAHTATFIGHVNPNSPEEEGSTSPAEEEAFKTHYPFECAPECPGLEGELVADKNPHEVSAEATDLIPGHPYSVVLVAENAGGSETAGPVAFTTEAVEPQIDATYATAVSETEATLGAKVNPGGVATTVHFEYLTLERYEADNEEFGEGTKETTESGSIGSNAEDQTETAEIEGLEPDTAYRYRVVATNAKASSGLPGPTKGFHTTAAAQSFSGECPENEQLRRENNSTALPDCRAYEMVSPVDKGGFDAVSRVPNLQFQAQASPAGTGVAYIGLGPFAGAKGSMLPDGRISSRSSAGWQTADITPPTPKATPLGPTVIGYDFSEDLSRFALKVPAQLLTGNSPPGAEGLYNLYTADTAGNYSLVNSAAIEAPPPSECKVFGGPVGCYRIYDSVSFAGASRDFSHVLFEADDSLEGTGAPAGIFLGNLYESSAGHVRLVGILPDGEVASGGSMPGAGGGFSGLLYTALGLNSWGNVNHAISADGSRVLFTAKADGAQPDPAQAGLAELYDRIEGNETVEVSAPAPGATPANANPEPAQFWNASDDGSLVFFTSAAELTTPSNTGAANNSEDLYRYDVDTETLTDLSVDTNPLDAESGAGVQGVVGTSSDGSYVYFVANGELIPGEGEDGQPNLYLYHGGQLEYITTLGGGDANDWTSIPAELRSYLTPDGKHLALMSTKSLPTANFPEGYDNTDQSTGGADSEVYTYSAEDGRLFCASCDPTGAQPTGGAFIGANPDHLASTPFHQPRVMSDSGNRLFFSSPGPLVHGEVSSHPKLFEYERGGVGSCAVAGGCILPISPALGTATSTFLDASADGRDVFFATTSRLTPRDEDTISDVYDARAGGGFPVPPPPPACEGEACAGSASTAPPGSSPGTSRFAGREEGPKHPRCGKGRVKRHGRCVSRKHTKKHHRSHKRRANTTGGAGK